MKENKTLKRLVIFSVAAVMCLTSVTILSATPFTGTPSPNLDPVFGTLIDFDDQPTGTPVGEFDYVSQGVASITETEGVGPLARYAGTQSLPNYVGTGVDNSWDGTILIELVYPTDKIGIGISDNEGGETLTIYDASMSVLETQITTGNTPNGYYGFERSNWDIMYLEITGDWFAVDDLQFNRLSIDVGKEIVDGDEFVPVFTDVSWELKITVTNNGDVDLDEIYVYDGIGAKLDLIIETDTTGDYIFTDDSGPLYFDDDENAYFGETEPVLWALANGKDPKNNGKHSATNLVWAVGDLDVGESKQLWFSAHTIAFQTGKGNKNDKQAFTSTCHHELNDGPIAVDYFAGNYITYWGDPVIVSVYSEEEDADSDGDGYTDLEEVNDYGTDPCYPDSHPIFVSGFDYDRNRVPLGGDYDLSALIVKDALLDLDNYGWGGTVPCPISFLDFVQTIETESLVDGDGNLLVDVFFAGLTATDLTTDEADELKAFIEAGGILYISGNSAANEGPSYHPLFTALGWSDVYSGSTYGDNYVQSSTPISTPVTTGPFGTVGPLEHSIFREFLFVTATCVAYGYPEADVRCLVAEATIGSNGGYISISGDPIYFDMFMGDDDNLNYFLNLFALAV